MESSTKLSEMFDYCSDSSIKSEDVCLEGSPAVPFEFKCLGQGQAEDKSGPVSGRSKSRLSQIFDSCSIGCEDVSIEASQVVGVKLESIGCASSFVDASRDLAIQLTDIPEAETFPGVSSTLKNEVKSEGFTAHDIIPTQRQTVFDRDKGIAREFRDSFVLEISSDSDDEENNEAINKMLNHGDEQYFKDSATATDTNVSPIPVKNRIVEYSPPFKSGLPSNAENSLPHKLVSPVKLRRSRKASASIIDDNGNLKYEVHDLFGATKPTLIDSDDDSAKQPKRMKRRDNLEAKADIDEEKARIIDQILEDAAWEETRNEEQANGCHSMEGNKVLHGVSSLLPKQGTNFPETLQDFARNMAQDDDDFARNIAQDDEDFARNKGQDDEDFTRNMAQDDEDFAKNMALAIEESLRSSFPRGEEHEAHTGSSFLRVQQPKKDVTTTEKKPKRSQIFDSYPVSSNEPEDIPSEPNLDFEDDQFNQDMARAIQESLATSGSSSWAGPTTAKTPNWTGQASATSFDYRGQATWSSRGHSGQTASTSRGHTGQPVPSLVNKAWEAQRNDLQNFGISEEERNRMLGDFGNNNIYGGNKIQDDDKRKRAIEKAIKSLHISLETMPAEGDEEEQPLSLRLEIKLYPHQKHGLAWMLSLENTLFQR